MGRKRRRSVTCVDDTAPKKPRNLSDSLCTFSQTDQLVEKKSTRDQEDFLNSEKQITAYRPTLENETVKGNYDYWLSDQDIRRIANVEYNSLYDIQTLSDNYENSAKGLAVIDVECLDFEIVQFKEIFHDGDVSSQTFIINLRESHWVTLVVSHQNGQYYGYYVDPLYDSDRAGNECNKIPDNVTDILNNRGVKIKDLKTHQQDDSHNCGLIALENAKDINDLLNGSSANDDEMLQRLQIPRDNCYFIDRRKYLTSKLNGWQRQVIEDQVCISKSEVAKRQFLTDKGQKSGDLIQDSYDGLYGCDRYTFAKMRGYFGLIGVMYQLQLLMLCFYRAFIVHKYDTFSLAAEEIGMRKFDDIVLHNENETICVQIKCIDTEKAYNSIGFVELFPRGKRTWEGMFSINKYFNSFIQYEVDDLKYLVLYTNTNLSLTEEKRLSRPRLCIGFFPLQFNSIDIEEEKYKILKGCLLTGDSRGEHGFYQFSRKKSTRKELLKLLDTPSPTAHNAKELKKLKKNFLDKLILAVNQPSREKLNSIIKCEIEKTNEPSAVPDIYNKLYEGMLSYLKNSEGIYITKKNVGRFWKHTEESTNMGEILGQAPKKYKKAPGLKNHTPYIMYKLEILMFSLYRMYKYKCDGLLISVESGIVNISSNIRLHYKGKITCLWIRCGHEGYIDYCTLFPNRKGKHVDMFSINRYFVDFIKQLGAELEEIEYLVIYTDMKLALTAKGKLEGAPIRFNSMDIKNHEVLSDYLCADDDVKDNGFYQFSRKASVRRQLLKLLDPWPFSYDTERLEQIKSCFLDKLILAVNQPDREKLSSIIKHEIGENGRYISPGEVLRQYIALREVVLRWLGDYKVQYIGRRRLIKLFEDIKNNKFSSQNIRIPNGDKDQFASTVVADRGLCHFRELREFLDTKEGEDMLYVLYKNKAERNISTMLSGTGIGVINVFRRLYYILFHKDGEKTNFLKSLIESDITLCNISSTLGRAGSKAPEALEALYTILNTKLDNGKTYVEFFTENKVVGNISSMLNGAGSKAPEALEALQIILNTKLDYGETYLEFFVEKNIMRNISSMLSGTEDKTPEALQALYTILSTKLDDGKTYLEFFVEKNIMGNISSMLSGAGNRAPEALEALYVVLNTKLNDGKTYLEFLAEKNVMGNISSMLSGAGNRAPEALKALCILLNTNLDGGKAYLEFFVEKNIVGNISSILHRAGDKAPNALKALFTILSTKLNGGKTYLEYFVEKNIMKNISSILHGAGNKAPRVLKALYAVLSTKLDGGNTYLEFFVEKNIMENISSMLNGAGGKATEALKVLFTILNTKLDDGKTYLEFFAENNVMKSISGMLSGAGNSAPEALKALYAVLSTKLDSGKTYLELFIEKNIMRNVAGILHGAGRKSSKALKALYTILSAKLGNGKTYLEFFVEKKIMGNVSSMLGGARHRAHRALRELHTMLNTKLDDGKTYLEFFVEKDVMKNVSSMLSGAGSKAPEALKALFTILNTKLDDGKTYLEFFSEYNVMKNISSMLSGAGNKAPEALKALYAVLSTKLDDEKTYLEFFMENNVMSSISNMLSGTGVKAPEALNALFALLNTKLDSGKTYLELFVEKNIMGSISSILGGARQKAHRALEELHVMLNMKLHGGKTYLEFFIEKNIMKNISSMLSGAGSRAPETLKTLYVVLSTKLGNEKTYLDFFVEKNIMKNISSMLSGAGNRAPEALKALYVVLNTNLDDGKTYLEFFVEENIMANMSSMLNRAGHKAPGALKELHHLLFSKKYLDHFTKEGFKLSNLSNMLHGTRDRAPYILTKVHELCFDVEGNKTRYFSDLVNSGHKPAELFSILRKAAIASPSSLDEQYICEEDKTTCVGLKQRNLSSKRKRKQDLDSLQQSNCTGDRKGTPESSFGALTVNSQLKR